MNTPFKFCLYISAALSLALPLAFLALGKNNGSLTSLRQGYAALILDETIDEAEVCTILNGLKVDFIAASKESAFLNEFSGVEAVPLASYFNRIEDYDPRNDGYAAQALQIFVSGGERRIFIPAEEFTGFGALHSEKLAAALQNIPFKLAFQNYAKSPVPALIFFAAAAALFILLAKKVSKITGDTFLVYYAVCFLPSFAILGKTGPGGLAVCAVLASVFQILRAPAQRFLTSLRYQRIETDSLKSLLKGEIIEKFAAELKPDIIKLVVLAALCTGIAIISNITTAAILQAFFCFFITFAALALTETMRSSMLCHVRFLFIPIRSEKYGTQKFPTLPIPFLGIMLVSTTFALCVPQTGKLASGSFDFLKREKITLNEADYQKHIEFQKSFAYRRLGNTSGMLENGGGIASSEEADAFLHYTTGYDTLIESAAVPEQPDFPNSADFQNPPPWKLGRLVLFLNGAGVSAPLLSHSGIASNLVAALFALCLYLPFVAGRHRKKTAYLIYS